MLLRQLLCQFKLKCVLELISNRKKTYGVLDYNLYKKFYIDGVIFWGLKDSLSNAWNGYSYYVWIGIVPY